MHLFSIKEHRQAVAAHLWRTVGFRMGLGLDPDHAFKTCTHCNFEWQTRSDFLSDPGVELLGYQANLDDLEGGAFLFNHTCRGTLALKVERFKDLRRGPIPTTRATGGRDCPEFCLHKDELRPCPADCECAYVRDIIQVVRHWPEQPVTA